MHKELNQSHKQATDQHDISAAANKLRKHTSIPKTGAQLC